MRVHWLGAGLSATFGIVKTAESKLFDFYLWNRDPARACRLLESFSHKIDNVRKFDLKELYSQLKENDLVISYLPAVLHYQVALTCLEKGAHLMTASYNSEEMLRLAPRVRNKGLYFFNELGLDPGIDHLFAHQLVRELQDNPKLSQEIAKISFYSGCGGFPIDPGPLCYKFSWSPLGVLRALKQRARWLEDSQVKTADRPWEAIRFMGIAGGETFESYPNRDSLPYLSKYGLKQDGISLDFQRTTLRPLGWHLAWAPIFQSIESNSDLEMLSQELFTRYCYRDNEKDRVVLLVKLRAYDKAGHLIFDRSRLLDQRGSALHSAMAQLVSGLTFRALEMFHDGVFQKVLPPGVYDFPFNEELNSYWNHYFIRPEISASSTVV